MTNDTMSRRGLLAGVPAIAITAAPAAAIMAPAAVATAPDPIFAAIEAYHDEHAAAEALSNEGYENVYEDEWDAFWTVFETVPTTAAGLVALFEFLMAPYGDSVPDGLRLQSRLALAFGIWIDNADNADDTSEEHITQWDWLAPIVTAMRNLMLGGQS